MVHRTVLGVNPQTIDLDGKWKRDIQLRPSDGQIVMGVPHVPGVVVQAGSLTGPDHSVETAVGFAPLIFARIGRGCGIEVRMSGQFHRPEWHDIGEQPVELRNVVRDVEGRLPKDPVIQGQNPPVLGDQDAGCGAGQKPTVVVGRVVRHHAGVVLDVVAIHIDMRQPEGMSDFMLQRALKVFVATQLSRADVEHAASGIGAAIDRATAPFGKAVNGVHQQNGERVRVLEAVEVQLVENLSHDDVGPAVGAWAILIEWSTTLDDLQHGWRVRKLKRVPLQESGVTSLGPAQMAQKEGFLRLCRRCLVAGNKRDGEHSHTLRQKVIPIGDCLGRRDNHGWRGIDRDRILFGWEARLDERVELGL